MKKAGAIIIGLSACMVLSMQQQLISIIPEDKTLCILPYHHIIESKTLQKLFLKEQDNKKNNPLCTLMLPSVSSQKLNLFSQALSQPLPTLASYFQGLSPEQRHMLVVAAGKWSKEGRQLNTKVLAAQLLTFCCGQEIIERHIYPRIDLTDFIDYLAQTTLRNNLTSEHITHQIMTDEHSCFIYSESGICCATKIPLSLLHLVQHQDISTESCFTVDDKTYTKECQKRRNDASCGYMVTSLSDLSNDPAASHHRQIWLTSDAGMRLVTGLNHPYSIDYCRFSHDGHFLVTSSNHAEWRPSWGMNHANESSIVLTSLGTQSHGFDFFHTVLTGYTGNPIDILWNPQATLVAAATTNGIYLWDTKGNLVKHLIDDDYSYVTSINWSLDGSILYALAMKPLINRTISRKLILYDMLAETHSIIPIIAMWAQDFILFPHHNIIIIPLQKHLSPQFVADGSLLSLSKMAPEEFDAMFDKTKTGLLLCNATTGHYISFISLPAGQCKGYECNRKGTLLAMVIADEGESTDVCGSRKVVLCDLISGKQTIIVEKSVVEGIMFTLDERCLITIHNDSSYTVSHLYDESTVACLDWLKEKPTLLQRYALQRMYKAHKLNDCLILPSQSLTLQVLQSLPTEPCNIKGYLKGFY